MGSPKSEKNHFGDEGPQHEIEIAPFWIGKYEITWDIYELFIAREIDSKKPTEVLGDEVSIEVDAVSGATQPYTMWDVSCCPLECMDGSGDFWSLPALSNSVASGRFGRLLV